MPILKLRKHQATFSEEDILINPSDYTGLKLRDVVELKPPNEADASNRILLQVRRWPDTSTYPNSVSIKDSVVNAHLKLYADVLVNIVDKKEVLVDSIEVCFSNAYLARSYMWGLRNYLNNRCVYQRQKLDYLHIRSQICEIWAQGNKVTSGYVDDDTKVVFRSASSLVYLFIQMSSEMWDYDINGDLYCEKAINGFLTDLFETWHRNDCSHDITIVLFSRTFYDAKSLEEFPKEMRECLQVDYKNRFYEDCYRVAFQNDRFDLHDWNSKLTTLKYLFNQYQKEVIDRHQEKYDTKIPRAYNSSAAQGNFLEVLNMSLNVFEKHYFDRSFDRTGQLSVVVSPGVGVFEVDFEMTNLTKQRIIDNGIGSDLVCLGEQPLHTVPLLKFNSKSLSMNDNLATCDVYNMPHWINLSFYSSHNQVYYSNFVPRIKLPTIHSKFATESYKSSLQTDSNWASTNGKNADSPCIVTDENSGKDCSNGRDRHQSPQQIAAHSTIPDLVDYDDYDAQVFKPKSMISYPSQQSSHRGDRSVLSDLDSNIDCLSDDDEEDFLERDNRSKTASVQRRSSDVKNYQEYSRNIKRQQISENLPITQPRVLPQVQTTFTRMSLVDSYLTDVKIKPESADDLSVRGYNVQSSRINRSTARPKALINPFDPSHMTIKLTPNRRRWTHVFPQGPTGTFMQQHHYQPVPPKNSSPYLADVSPPVEEQFSASISVPSGKCDEAASKFDNTSSLINQNHTGTTEKNLQTRRKADNLSLILPGANYPSSKVSSIGNFSTPSGYNKSTLVSNDTIRFAWCASGEQEWTPAITTGVDWKSLTMPACLPLTTDFFPSKTSLQNDYVIGEYTIDSNCIHYRYTLIEVYRELVCQRLQKGFQIILLPRQAATQTSSHSSFPIQKLSSTKHRSSSSSHHRHAGSQSASTPIIENEAERERTEYTMSIGRIFHKLSLHGNTITVTQYKPRHPYPTIKIDYCYRFRAPFHETYGQSWVHFKSEKLENYSWNYLDNYICARGESFELRSSLKFWRFRILILPSKQCLRQIVHPGGNENRHDIHYLEYSSEERSDLMESFNKLLEIINKTRRTSASRMSSSSYSCLSVNSSGNSMRSSQHVTVKQQDTPNQVPAHMTTRLDVQIYDCEIKSSPEKQAEKKPARKLELVSINMDIDSALRDAKRSEWVHVQYHCYYDLDQAYELLIKWMVASGAGIAEMVQGWSRKVGSSSVHVVPIPWEPFALPYSGKADPLRCPIGIELHLNCLPEGQSLEGIQVIRFQEKILRRFGFLIFQDLISSENIERQFIHMSGFAFVALPNLDSDTDDAASKEMRLASDLASGQPILSNISPIDQQQSGLPTKSPSKASSSSSTKFGLSIVKQVVGSGKQSDASGAPMVSGLRLEHQDTINSPHEEYITRHINGARQTNRENRLNGKNEQIEFIWSWNYMLTKRWRSLSTQNESNAVSLMQDFKEFCQNANNRLVEFWKEVKDSLLEV